MAVGIASGRATAGTLVQRWVRGPDVYATIGVAAVVGIVTAFALAVERTDFDTWAGLLVGAALVGLSFPLVRLAARKDADIVLRRALFWAFLAKIFSALPRFLVVFAVYDGNADAETYHGAGVDLAVRMRAGELFPHVEGATGTSFLKWLTGAVYAITGPTRLGGFFVFSWIGFWGLWLFYRAFVTACPEGHRRRYFALVFFLPSLLFWPSSIGKEAWMTLGLGLSAWGAARLLTHQRGGFLALAAGFAATAAVRPHIAVIFAMASFSAIVLRRPPKGASITAPIAKLGVTVVMAMVLILAVNQAEAFFGVDTFNIEAAQAARKRAAGQTDEGGSAFDSGSERTDFSLSKLPSATVSVLFRPFPWEANNPQALIASAEGAFVLALLAASWRRVAGALRSIVRTPYVLLCCTYALVFVYGFSSFSNFGILTRQRVQVMPFVLVLVCLPPLQARHRGWRSLLVDP